MGLFSSSQENTLDSHFLRRAYETPKKMTGSVPVLGQLRCWIICPVVMASKAAERCRLKGGHRKQRLHGTDSNFEDPPQNKNRFGHAATFQSRSHPWGLPSFSSKVRHFYAASPTQRHCERYPWCHHGLGERKGRWTAITEVGFRQQELLALLELNTTHASLFRGTWLKATKNLWLRCASVQSKFRKQLLLASQWRARKCGHRRLGLFAKVLEDFIRI